MRIEALVRVYVDAEDVGGLLAAGKSAQEERFGASRGSSHAEERVTPEVALSTLLGLNTATSIRPFIEAHYGLSVFGAHCSSDEVRLLPPDERPASDTSR